MSQQRRSTRLKKAGSNAASSVASETKNTVASKADGKKQDDFNAENVVASIIRIGDEYCIHKLTKARLQEVLGAFARRYTNDTHELQSRNDELELENKRLTKERDHAREYKSGLRVANVDRIIALEKLKDERAKEEAATRALAAPEEEAAPTDEALQPPTNNDVVEAQPTTITPPAEQETAEEVEVRELEVRGDTIMMDADTPSSANSLEASPNKTFVSRFLRPFKNFFSPAKSGPRPLPAPAERPQVPLGELPANRKRAAPDPEPGQEPPAQRPALEAFAAPAQEQAQQEPAQKVEAAQQESGQEAEAAPSIMAAPEPQLTQPAVLSTPSLSMPYTPTPNMARNHPPRVHTPFGNALAPISERTEPSQAGIRRTPGTNPGKRPSGTSPMKRPLDTVRKQKAREQVAEAIRLRERGRPPPAFSPFTGLPNPPMGPDYRERPDQRKARIDALIMHRLAEMDEDEEADEESKRLATKRVNTDGLAEIPHRRPGDPSSTFRLPEIDSDGDMDVDEDYDDWTKNIFGKPAGTEWYPKPLGKDYISLTEQARRCEQEYEQAQEQVREQARQKEVFSFPTVGTMPAPRKDGEYDDFLGKKFAYGLAAWMRGEPGAVKW